MDTSVIDGCLDKEFRADSLLIFEEAKRGKLLILVSDIVYREIDRAPNSVQAVLKSLPAETLEEVEVSEEAIELRDAYLSQGVLGPESVEDAAHVALATVGRADAIVSWNFRHIVRLDKIREYNRINMSKGYGTLAIVSPKEVNQIGRENN